MANIIFPAREPDSRLTRVCRHFRKHWFVVFTVVTTLILIAIGIIQILPSLPQFMKLPLDNNR
jgi:hypothetical protein